jgi:hypothetical protein
MHESSLSIGSSKIIAELKLVDQFIRGEQLHNVEVTSMIDVWA